MELLSPKRQSDTGVATFACSACYRRKLKCDRKRSGCNTCLKSSIPCIYTTPGTATDGDLKRGGVSRKRGPYNKGKTPREKELEHVIELLQEKCSALQSEVQHPSSSSKSKRNVDYDALSTIVPIQNPQMPVRRGENPVSIPQYETLCPSPGQVLELWTLYKQRVDPLTKLIHAPSFEEKLLASYKDIRSLPTTMQTLLLSIYFAAVKSLTPLESVSNFGRSQDSLLRQYGQGLDGALKAADRASDGPSLEVIQAAGIYLGSIRRQHNTSTDVQSLFALAVRLARRLGLDQMSNYENLTPFNAEMSRRAWWGLCRHESSYAEELNKRSSSIMQTADIPLPRNYNDEDLYPEMLGLPTPRSGLTDISLCLLNLEAIRLVSSLAFCTKEKPAVVGFLEMKNSQALRMECKRLVDETRNRVEQSILQHCDLARTCDYLMLLVAKILLTKVEILLLEPPAFPDGALADSFHDTKVSLALDIMECHQIIISEQQLRRYAWKYRGLHQWSACLYVLEEICRRPTATFAARAWQIIDLVMASSDVDNIDGLTERDRLKLLEAHASAITAQAEQKRRQENTTRKTDLDYHTRAETTRTEPWHFDLSLFDVQDVRMNMAVFFPWATE